MTGRRGADRVAFVLALALGLISILILVATTIQIVDHQSPDITLSENATQILIAAIGGLTGLLGGYLGYSIKAAERDEDDKAIAGEVAALRAELARLRGHQDSP